MKTEYISTAKTDLSFMEMKKGRYTVDAIKDGNGGFFLRFFDGHVSHCDLTKLPKYILVELDNFISVCTKILSFNQ